MAELVARQPQLHVDQAYVVISRALHAAARPPPEAPPCVP